MKKGFLSFVLVVLCIASIASLGVGCSSSNNGGGGGGGSVNTANVDLAVGDLSGQVGLYFNILSFFPNDSTGLYPGADVILDNAGSGIQSPGSLVFTGADREDLVVCDVDFLGLSSGNDTIKIFRDYQNLTDGAAPDTTFTNGGALVVTNPNICIYDQTNDIFIFTNNGVSAVVLIDDFSATADGTDPAVTAVVLDNAGSHVIVPSSVALSGADLWVANSGATAPGDPCVLGFNDITTLASADVPDVELDIDVSFYRQALGSPFTCTTVAVGDNAFNSGDTDTLYVTTSDGSVFLFNDAQTVASNALPDVVLLPGAGQTDLPVAVEQIGSRLFVPNLTLAGAVGIAGCGNAPAISIFDPVGGLVTGQALDAGIYGEIAANANAFDITQAAGALFASGLSNCSAIPGINGTSNVIIFRDPANVTSASAPDILIPGSSTIATDLLFPVAVAANAVDLGTL